MFNYLFVGGHFGEEPKESGFMRKLFEAIHAINPNGLLKNGGYFTDLQLLVRTFEHVKNDVIFWMPDVSNDEKKLVDDIKKLSPHSLLITSKNNRQDKYDFQELVSRMLKVKANLCLEITKGPGNDFNGSVLDPLGNQFCDSTDINRIATTLVNRVQELMRFTRVGSRQIRDDKSDFGPIDAPEEFFTLVRDYADVFHDCIHGVNTDRMLGNTSFRCERGFPSHRTEDGQVFVSRRNIDKRFITPDNFVPIQLRFGEKPFIAYWGEHKPSVDSPLQLLLYNYYPKIKYMLHSHTYISGWDQTSDGLVSKASWTSKKISCGAVEEFYEIIKLYPERNRDLMQINLKGHGSLVMASKVEQLRDIHYEPRPQPEC